MGLITKVVGNGIGLVTECNATHKASKSPSRPTSHLPPKAEDDDADGSTDRDEENRELDEAQREAVPGALSGEDGA
jgi:hypothetical protein